MRIGILVITVVLMFSCWSAAFAVNPLNGRKALINFQGKLSDSEGLAFDGTANAEAWYYNANERRPENFVYAESFDDIKVEHGLFRLPLLGGAPQSGGASIDSLAKQDGLFVDLKINGKTLLELEPIGAAFASVRSEVARKAEMLRKPIVFSEGDIPVHDAGLITSGRIDPARLPPSISASNVASGVFGLDALPAISADMIADGAPFPAGAMPNDLNAQTFTSGILSSSVISQEVMRWDEIYFNSGRLSHGEAIPIPQAFSRSQCNWIVGLRYINGFDGIDQWSVGTDENGVVSCRWSPGDVIDQVDVRMQCSANYLVICRR